MTARDDYPILNDLALGRFGAHATREINRAFDEIDRLRAVEQQQMAEKLAEIRSLLGSPYGYQYIVLAIQGVLER